MDVKDRIRIPDKRGPMPRHFEFADRGPYTVQQKLRILALALFIGAIIYGLIYAVLR